MPSLIPSPALPCPPTPWKSWAILSKLLYILDLSSVKFSLLLILRKPDCPWDYCCFYGKHFSLTHHIPQQGKHPPYSPLPCSVGPSRYPLPSFPILLPNYFSSLQANCTYHLLNTAPWFHLHCYSYHSDNFSSHTDSTLWPSCWNL